MNILILNGSPKGKFSITIQTMLYFQAKYKEHTFTFLNVGQEIKQYERNFTKAFEPIQNADLIIFSYPVYTFLVPYQLHRFIELLKDNNIDFDGKFVGQFSTSKHFFDTTAHKFIEENIYDLKGKYVGGLSADMDDLINDKGRNQADCFFNRVMFDIENNIYKEQKSHLNNTVPTYNSSLSPVNKTTEKDVLLITNTTPEQHNLNNMITDFINVCPYEVRIINLREFKFGGGCLGCLNCTTTSKCIYKDNFDDYLRENIHTSDAIIYAFTIENHYTQSSFKCYDDRQFCNGHRSMTHGMPVGYIISGDYENESNIQTLVEARSEVGGVYLSGVATDEYDTANRLENLSKSLDYALLNKIDKPANFYGVGGTKIFRDLVYLMRGMMKADHKYYKSHGIYDDFPHNQKLKMVQMGLVGVLFSSPKLKAKMGNMNKYIIMPYEKIIDSAKSD